MAISSRLYSRSNFCAIVDRTVVSLLVFRSQPTVNERLKMSEAKRVRIVLGSLEFDGYMVVGQVDEDGFPIFGFNLTQAAMMLGLTDDTSQAVKRSIQESKTKFAQTHFPQGFGSIPKVKGETDSGVIRALTILPIQGFEKLALCAVVSGKTQAIHIQAALAGYSLRKIFSRSFGVKFTDEEAESWIASRFVGIEKRNLWTDAIKGWTLNPGLSENAKKWVYSNVSDRLNVALTGHKGRYWCDKLGCDSSTLRNYGKHKKAVKLSHFSAEIQGNMGL